MNLDEMYQKLSDSIKIVEKKGIDKESFQPTIVLEVSIPLDYAVDVESASPKSTDAVRNLVSAKFTEYLSTAF